MFVSKYTEQFVKICVEDHLKNVKYPEYKDKWIMDPLVIKVDKEIHDETVKILFRIEHYNLPENASESYAIAQIIDKSIGSNYCANRPSEESLHEIIMETNKNDIIGHE